MSQMSPIHLCSAYFCKVFGLNFFLLFMFRFSCWCLFFRFFFRSCDFHFITLLQFGDSEVMQFLIKQLLPASLTCPSTCLNYVFLHYIHHLLAIHSLYGTKPHTHTNYSYIYYLNIHFSRTAGLRTDLISNSLETHVWHRSPDMTYCYLLYIDLLSVTVFTAICCSSFIKSPTSLYALCQIGLLFDVRV